MGGTATCIGCWFRAYMAFHSTKDSCSNPGRCCYLVHTTTNLEKVIQTFYHASCFKIVGNMLTTLNSMSMGPLWHFICCEVRPLIRGKTVCNTIMVDNKFSWIILMMRSWVHQVKVGVARNKTGLMHKMVYLIYLIIKILLCWWPLGKHSQGTNISLCVFTYSESM